MGSAPDWIRLPSLIAGTATIPMIYLLGVRTVSRAAGLLGAAVVALSPFMIYYSTEARSYALMIALVAASTLALLAALRSGRARWWVGYAACSCGALYSHYTSVFPLAAQFAWVLWFHRRAFRPLLLANLGVLAGFAPWIPGFIADNNSPTTEILSRLQPFTWDAVTRALENWSIGYPYVDVQAVPGNLGWVLIASGVVLAAAAVGVRAWRRRHGSRSPLGGAFRRVRPGIALIAMLALATPVGEAVYTIFGPSNLLGARNLNASWPGLAVAIGAIVTAAGGPLSLVCATLVLAGFAIGGKKALDSGFARSDYAGVASAIDDRWVAGDVVMDGTAFLSTPVPLTGLDVYLPQTHREFRLGLPVSDHPFTLADVAPPIRPQISQAFKDARGQSIFLVAYLPSGASLGTTTRRAAQLLRAQDISAGEVLPAGEVLRRLPPQFKITGSETFSGLTPFVVFTIKDLGSPP